MKKVLITDPLMGLFSEGSGFLDREDITVLGARTHDEVLTIHRRERIDLIVTRIDAAGMRTEDLFEIIRNDEEMKNVSTILVCQDTLVHRQRCKQCRANAFFTTPVDIALLHLKVQQLLNIVPRKTYRAAVALAIPGTLQDRPLPFWTENISASGMLIRSEERLETGDGIFFSFFLSDGTHASGYGEIARVVEAAGDGQESTLYGIKFTNVDPDVKSAIELSVIRQAQE